MQLFEQNDKVQEIYLRALSLAISKDFAHKKNGEIFVAEKQNSEQENRRRELLEVEEQANKNKIIEEHGQNHFKTQVMSKFFAKVTTQVNTLFENKEYLYQQVLKIDNAAPDLLEILSLRAASINRVTPLVKSMPWLANEVISLVNKPQYRKRADVQVSDANLAISYIGLENLKLVMPTYILKHWLPISTSPFPLMKRKLWNESLSVALASKALAQHHKVDWYTAFAAGMLSNIGLLAVTRCFITTYNELYNAEIREAYENRDKRLHDILLEFDSAPELLLEQLISRSYKIGANLIEQMNFDRLPITEPMFDLAFATNAAKLSKVAGIVAKARAYVCFRSLAKDDLIDNTEAKILLASAQMTAEEISILKKSDIDHIKLNFS